MMRSMTGARAAGAPAARRKKARKTGRKAAKRVSMPKRKTAKRKKGT
jgi:hypothetical protein